jgi:hypothetical protein
MMLSATKGRELYGAPKALKEWRANVLFQSANLLRERWLGDSEFLSSPGKAAGTGHGMEIAELMKFHISTIYVSSQL